MVAVGRMIVLGLAVSTAAGGIAWAGNKVVVGRHWPVNQQTPIDAVDHRLYDQLLRQYVTDRGRVDYRRWKATPADVERLDAYLGQLSRADPRRSSRRPAQLAFWINAYNAVTLRGILREYPTKSIRDHTARLIGYNIWEDLLLQVGQQQFSLGQIENEILRKAGEPRIHFAIVCASISCPRLRNEAYQAQKLEQQLADNTRHFFAQPGNLQTDRQRSGGSAPSIGLSSIMKWYAEDFGPDLPRQLRTIAPYLPADVARVVRGSSDVSVRYLPYDWGLNEVGR